MKKDNFNKNIGLKMSRRQVLKAGLVGGAAFFWHGDTLFGLFGGSRVALAAIPGGTLDPKTVPKYVTSLVIPPAMPNIGTANNYSIAVKQFQQQILPTPFPETTVWSYGATNNLGTLNYPAFTIEAVRKSSTTVTWINGLVDNSGNYLPHLLPVDPTLHWANPPGGPMGRDMRPIFSSTPGPYTGPVPIITHVHGMENVKDWSDGYAEAWYLPAAGNIPAGYATRGTWYDFFQSKAGGGWAQGTATFVYPNSQRPSTAWYHDHTLGMYMPARPDSISSGAKTRTTTRRGSFPGLHPSLAMRRTPPTTKSRSPFRIAHSISVGHSFTRTTGPSSTASSDPSFRSLMFPQSGTRSSLATTWL